MHIVMWVIWVLLLEVLELQIEYKIIQMKKYLVKQMILFNSEYFVKTIHLTLHNLIKLLRMIE